MRTSSDVVTPILVRASVIIHLRLEITLSESVQSSFGKDCNVKALDVVCCLVHEKAAFILLVAAPRRRKAHNSVVLLDAILISKCAVGTSLGDRIQWSQLKKAAIVDGTDVAL